MSTEIALQDQIKDLVLKTNDTLSLNKGSVEKAVEFGKALIAKIEGTQMSDQLDEECNGFLVKLKKTNEMISERRKPITQLFDQVKSEFTALENQISQKSSTYTTIQMFRDGYAKLKAEEKRKAEIEAKRKLDVATERTEVAAKYEAGIGTHFGQYLLTAKTSLISKFNGLTIENYPVESIEIINFSTRYPLSHFDSFRANVMTVYMNEQDQKELLTEVQAGKYELYLKEFSKEISELISDLTLKLPAKKEELLAMAEAEKNNKAEADRLKAEKEKREKEEAERIAKEAIEREKKAVETAEINKAGAQMNNLFEAAASEAVPVSSAQVKNSLKIKVTNPAGYMQIFQAWFEKEGKSLTGEQIEKKTIGQMVAFCEKTAMKDGEIINSAFIKYEEDFKAIAKSK